MQGNVIVRRIRRAEPAVIAALGAAGTATVHEAIGRRGYVGPDIRPIQQGVRLAGSAVTVSSHPGDNLMIHAAVEVCAGGRHPRRHQHRTVDARDVRRTAGDAR